MPAGIGLGIEGQLKCVVGHYIVGQLPHEAEHYSFGKNALQNSCRAIFERAQSTHPVPNLQIHPFPPSGYTVLTSDWLVVTTALLAD
jgi:hypothetical protein